MGEGAILTKTPDTWWGDPQKPQSPLLIENILTAKQGRDRQTNKKERNKSSENRARMNFSAPNVA